MCARRKTGERPSTARGKSLRADDAERLMSTVSLLALVVAILALAVSALTAWLTLLRKGEVRMTQPTVIYFGPDGGFKAEDAPPKVFLRTLLFSTGKQGHIIENMFLRLHRGETRQNFNVWVYGDKELSRGSGLFVPETGLAANHHFVLPADGTFFHFLLDNMFWRFSLQKSERGALGRYLK
jgi:hypothetical protein